MNKPQMLLFNVHIPDKQDQSVRYDFTYDFRYDRYDFLYDFRYDLI